MKVKVARILVFMVLAVTMIIPVNYIFAEEQSDPEAATSQSQTAETQAEDQQKELVSNVNDEMKFLYIESRKLESPGTQNIAVSWKENIDEVEKFVLVYENKKGKTFTLEEKNRTEHSILFTKEFSSKEVDEYTVKGVKFYVDGIENYLEFDDVEIDAAFQIVNEIPDAQDVSDETVVVDIDADGSVDKKEVNSQIEAVLDSVGDETGDLVNAGRDIVIVLDPGHGGSDVGARRGSVYEKTINFKVAQYCKAELEQYEGVKVYMTRTGDTNPSLAERAQIAKNYNADILVSIHQNSGSSSAYGAEVYYPNQNYKPAAGTTGKGVASAIQSELTKLGLSDRGIKIRNTANGSTYPDGSYSDYYGVIRESKKRGMAGIIVEHAFLSNAQDYNRFLSSDSKLKQLGVADATGIAKYFRLSKEPGVAMEEGTYAINSVADPANIMKSEKETLTLTSKDSVNSDSRFELVEVSSKRYKILVESSGKALDVKKGSSESGTEVRPYTWNDSNAQIWKFVDAGNGSYYIRSEVGTYLTLNDDGSGFVASNLVKSDAQKFQLTVSDQHPVEDGVYSIVSSQKDSKVLDVSKASINDKANIQLYQNNDTIAQQFHISYAGKGYYSIITEHSNKAFDVASASLKSGANVQQYRSNGSNAQLWKFIEAEDGSYYIKSKLGTVLSIEGDSLNNGANINVQNMRSVDTQQWKLKKIQDQNVENGTYLIASQKDSLRLATQKNNNIQINVIDNADAQRYEIEYVADGYYRIINKASGKVLDVTGQSREARVNLQQADWNGGDGQLWRFISTGEGSYFIKSKLGTFMDSSSGSMDENNNIWMYGYNGSLAQSWILDASRVNAEDQPIEDGTYIFTSALKDNCVMDITGGSLAEKADVQLYGSNNTSAQRFEVTYLGDGYYKIVSEKSGKALDLANGSGASRTPIWQMNSSSSDTQKWKFINAGSGQYYIKSTKGTFVDVSGGKAQPRTKIQSYYPNGTSAQKWSITKNTYRPVKEGEYAIKSYLNSMCTMELAGNEAEDGANIQLGRLSYSDYQKFTVKYDADGYYRIYVTKSGKCLDVAGNSAEPGANIQQAAESQADGQLWKFIDADDGTYYIRSKLGTVMDAAHGKAVPGTNIQSYRMNGTDAQRWKIGEESLTSIEGATITTADEFAKYYNSKKKSYPYSGNSEAPTIEKFAQIYIEECNAEGIRAEVAFCQAMKETGWLQFGGDVKANQYNFAGIGATGGGKPGHSFGSIRTGIRAHVQHLKAYANKEALKNTCVDPRFSYVTRGTAPYVEWLGIKANPYGKGWAPAADYGTSIVKMMKSI